MPNGNDGFSGKVAFVTGAGAGIGRAAALAFAREGASVVVADASEANNRETARIIEQAGGRALAVRCDVSRDEDVKAALEKTIEVFGRLDYALNNAGIEQAIMPLADLTVEQWDRLIAVDLRGVFLCMKYQIPLMLKQGGGSIVNTSSGAGIKGFAGQAGTARPNLGLGSIEGGSARLRQVERSSKRRMPRHHRNADDGPLQWRHTGGKGKGDRTGADRTDGKTRGNRRGRRLAVLRRGGFCRRPRNGRRWRSDSIGPETSR